MHFRPIAALGLCLIVAACSPATSASAPASTEASVAPSTSTAPAASATAAPLSGSLNFVFGSNAPQSQWEAYFKDFLAVNPGVKINYIPVPIDQGWGQYIAKVAALQASGQKIDLMWLATEGTPALADKKVIAPIDQYLAADSANPQLQEYLSDVSPTLLKALQYQGRQYGLPFSWNNMVVWYNPKLLAAANLPPPPANWTWDDFLKYAQALTKPGQWGTYVGSDPFTMSAWAFNNGTGLLNSDWTKAQFTDPKTVATFQYVKDLVYKYKVAPAPGPDVPATFDLFQAEKLAMFFAGRWPIGAFKPAGFTDFDIAPMPSNTGNSATVIGVDGFYVGANSSDPALAWTVAREIASSKGTQQLLVTGIGDSASSNIPTRESLGTDPGMAPPANSQAFWNSLTYATSNPTGIYYPEWTAIYDRYMSQIMGDTLSIQDGLNQMQTDIQKVLDGGG